MDMGIAFFEDISNEEIESIFDNVVSEQALVTISESEQRMRAFLRGDYD